jgi:hypothetical protein
MRIMTLPWHPISLEVSPAGVKTLSAINAKTAYVSTVGKMAPVIDMCGSELTTE